MPWQLVIMNIAGSVSDLRKGLKFKPELLSFSSSPGCLNINSLNHYLADSLVCFVLSAGRSIFPVDSVIVTFEKLRPGVETRRYISDSWSRNYEEFD